jgi:hypothetical protein
MQDKRQEAVADGAHSNVIPLVEMIGLVGTCLNTCDNCKGWEAGLPSKPPSPTQACSGFDGPLQTLEDRIALFDRIPEQEVQRRSNTPSKPPSQRQIDMLLAMHNLKATDWARRKKTEDIASAAEGPAANPDNFKRPMSDLKKRGLVDTKGSPDGGCWLTNEGISFVKELPKNR